MTAPPELPPHAINPNSLIALRNDFEAFKRTAVERIIALENEVRIGRRRIADLETLNKVKGEIRS